MAYACGNIDDKVAACGYAADDERHGKGIVRQKGIDLVDAVPVSPHDIALGHKARPAESQDAT